MPPKPPNERPPESVPDRLPRLDIKLPNRDRPPPPVERVPPVPRQDPPDIPEERRFFEG